jgi:hypothetical protein
VDEVGVHLVKFHIFLEEVLAIVVARALEDLPTLVLDALRS